MRKLHFPLFFLLFLAFLVSNAQVQQLMPFEVRQAYQNGTRSISGNPGPNYWQNRSEYKIQAELLTKESILKGEEEITYFNNSPDSLTKIVLRLYPDVLKKGNARNWPLGADAMNDGTEISWLKINDEEIDLKDRKVVYRSATNLHVTLSSDLLPGDSVSIAAKWQFEVPTRTVRMGNYGDNRFFLAYWYPQMAVYDDIDGWDNVEYHGTVEYYNDFSDYDVSITTPEGFLVWGTGDLQNEDDLYKKNVVTNLEKARNTDEVVEIFSAKDCREGKVLKNKGKNTWRLVAEGVPDFSFASADEMNWKGASPIVDKTTGRRALASAVFPDSTRTFSKGGEWSVRTLEYFSNKMPGFPFPYSHMTSFCNGKGGGGMETPMMANDGDPSSDASALGLIAHENAHTYFPFLTGINERKYAWMDEGWAVFLPIGLMESDMPDHKYLERTVSSFEDISGKEKESTLMTLSYQIAGYGSYRYHAYVRSSMAYYFLQDALGDSVFKASLNGFIERWQGKHPLPYDFFNTFVNLSGQKLLWFIKPWFFDKAYADLGIKKVTLDNKIVIENVGGLPLPVEIFCEFEDGSSETYKESTNVWRFGESAVVLQLNPDKKISMITLGSERIPDVNKQNDQMVPLYE